MRKNPNSMMSDDFWLGTLGVFSVCALVTIALKSGIAKMPSTLYEVLVWGFGVSATILLVALIICGWQGPEYIH